ncbi:MAG: rod shape-determining protein MreD [Gammaproteobacteria bacterium]|jgi:rod shape-determining protein MreD|nr:rod shape-determining protein MreD [Gammaproteobacteria bacterium]
MNPSHGGWLILLTIALAMVLAIFHVPESWPQWLGWLRPAWLAMVVFYWVMELPHRLGLISAWVIGLLLDVLYADPLGLNGFLLAAITYVVWRFYERLRMYSIVQQCIVVFLLVLVTESLRIVVQDVAWSRGWSWGVILPALMSMLTWPFVYLVLQRARLQVRVE